MVRMMLFSYPYVFPVQSDEESVFLLIFTFDLRGLVEGLNV
jgi:hypothetical protein